MRLSLATHNRKKHACDSTLLHKIAVFLLATEAADKTMREIRDLAYAEDAAHHEDDAQADDARNHERDEAAENVRDVDDACDAPGCELGNNAAR